MVVAAPVKTETNVPVTKDLQAPMAKVLVKPDKPPAQAAIGEPVKEKSDPKRNCVMEKTMTATEVSMKAYKEPVKRHVALEQRLVKQANGPVVLLPNLLQKSVMAVTMTVTVKSMKMVVPAPWAKHVPATLATQKPKMSGNVVVEHKSVKRTGSGLQHVPARSNPKKKSATTRKMITATAM